MANVYVKITFLLYVRLLLCQCLREHLVLPMAECWDSNIYVNILFRLLLGCWDHGMEGRYIPERGYSWQYIPNLPLASSGGLV